VISSGFYSEFKRSINLNYEELISKDEEIELFGLINIALNKNNLGDIYEDLKLIHHLALENPKVDFKTSVDLYSEASLKLHYLIEEQQEIVQEKILYAMLYSLKRLIIESSKHMK